MKETVIPRHEPEVLNFASESRYAGRLDQVPDTALASVVFLEVRLVSEKKRAFEYEAMVKLVRETPAEYRDYMHSIVTPGGHCYIVMIATDEPSTACSIASAITQVCQRLFKGHNGVTVQRRSGRSVRVAAQWGGVLG